VLDGGVIAVLCFDERELVGAVGEDRRVAPVGPQLGLWAERAGAGRSSAALGAAAPWHNPGRSAVLTLRDMPKSNIGRRGSTRRDGRQVAASGEEGRRELAVVDLGLLDEREAADRVRCSRTPMYRRARHHGPSAASATADPPRRRLAPIASRCTR